jgi:tetratricopeptide (TPR) repeat protein
VYYAQHEDTRALLCFETLLKNNSQNVVVMTMTGNIYRRRKEFDRAMDHYEKALELEPENNFALFGMGDCYRGKMNMEKAVEWWDRILEHEPENQALWTRVGDALLSLNKIDEAISHYEASLKNGADVFSFLGLARAQHALGDLPKAREYCEKALAQDETSERVLERLVNICEDAGDFKAADQARDKLKQAEN